MLVIFLILVSTSALAQEYEISHTHIDRFYCKDNISDSVPYKGINEPTQLDKKEVLLFDEYFKEGVKKEGSFEIQDSWTNGRISHYILTDKDLEVHVETDGAVFLLREPKTKVRLDHLKNNYGNFRSRVKTVKYSLKNAIENVTGHSCDPSSYNHALLAILNIKNYPTHVFNSCMVTKWPFFVDCSLFSEIRDIEKEMWSTQNFAQHYKLSRGDLIITSSGDYEFNKPKRYDHMTDPLVVFSNGTYQWSIGLGGGNGPSFLVEHVRSVFQLENLRKTRGDVEDELLSIEKRIKSIYKSIEEKKKKRREQEAPNPFTEFNESSLLDHIEKLEEFQNEYYAGKRIENEEPLQYYEDIYYHMTRSYLSRLNGKIEVLKYKIDSLRKALQTHTKFMSDWRAEIRDREAIKSTFMGVTLAILVSIALFFFDKFLNRYGRGIAILFSIICLFFSIIVLFFKEIFIASIIFSSCLLILWLFGDFVVTMNLPLFERKQVQGLLQTLHKANKNSDYELYNKSKKSLEIFIRRQTKKQVIFAEEIKGVDRLSIEQSKKYEKMKEVTEDYIKKIKFTLLNGQLGMDNSRLFADILIKRLKEGDNNVKRVIKKIIEQKTLSAQKKKKVKEKVRGKK